MAFGGKSPRCTAVRDAKESTRTPEKNSAISTYPIVGCLDAGTSVERLRFDGRVSVALEVAASCRFMWDMYAASGAFVKGAELQCHRP